MKRLFKCQCLPPADLQRACILLWPGLAVHGTWRSPVHATKMVRVTPEPETMIRRLPTRHANATSASMPLLRAALSKFNAHKSIQRKLRSFQPTRSKPPSLHIADAIARKIAEAATQNELVLSCDRRICISSRMNAAHVLQPKFSADKVRARCGAPPN